MQTQYAAKATHSLRNQEGGTLVRIIEGCGMELDILHILNRTLGSVYHRDTVTRCNVGIGSCVVDITHASCRQNSNLRQDCHYLLAFLVKDIGSVALNALSALIDLLTQVVLSEQIDSEMMFKDIDIAVTLHLTHQSALNLRTGQILMVEDTVFAVTTLAVE